MYQRLNANLYELYIKKYTVWLFIWLNKNVKWVQNDMQAGNHYLLLGSAFDTDLNDKPPIDEKEEGVTNCKWEAGVI